MHLFSWTQVPEQTAQKCSMIDAGTSLAWHGIAWGTVVTPGPCSTQHLLLGDLWCQTRRSTWLKPPLWLKNRTSNLLKRISFSVSRINNLHTEVASFSAFLWPSPNFRSLREKCTRSWKIRPATRISFELKAPPNQNQWAVWFGPAWISLTKLFKVCSHNSRSFLSTAPFAPRGHLLLLQSSYQGLLLQAKVEAGRVASVMPQI